MTERPSSTVAARCIPMLGPGSINGKFLPLIRHGRSMSSSPMPRSFALPISTSCLRSMFLKANAASCSIGATHGSIQALPGIPHGLDGKESSSHVRGPRTQTLSLKAISNVQCSTPVCQSHQIDQNFIAILCCKRYYKFP